MDVDADANNSGLLEVDGGFQGGGYSSSSSAKDGDENNAATTSSSFGRDNGGGAGLLGRRTNMKPPGFLVTTNPADDSSDTGDAHTAPQKLNTSKRARTSLQAAQELVEAWKRDQQRHSESMDPADMKRKNSSRPMPSKNWAGDINVDYRNIRDMVDTLTGIMSGMSEKGLGPAPVQPLTPNKSKLEQEKKQLVDEIEKQKEANKPLQENVKSKEVQIQALQTAVSERDQLIQELQQQLKSKPVASENPQQTEKIRQLREVIEQRDQTIQGLQEQVKSKPNVNQQQTEKIAQLNATVKQRDETIQQLQQQVLSKSKENQQQADKITDLNSEDARKQAAIQSYARNNQELTRQNTEAKDQLQSTVNEAKTLVEQQQSRIKQLEAISAEFDAFKTQAQRLNEEWSVSVDQWKQAYEREKSMNANNNQGKAEATALNAIVTKLFNDINQGTLGQYRPSQADVDQNTFANKLEMAVRFLIGRELIRVRTALASTFGFNLSTPVFGITQEQTPGTWIFGGTPGSHDYKPDVDRWFGPSLSIVKTFLDTQIFGPNNPRNTQQDETGYLMKIGEIESKRVEMLNAQWRRCVDLGIANTSEKDPTAWSNNLSVTIHNGLRFLNEQKHDYGSNSTFERETQGVQAHNKELLANYSKVANIHAYDTAEKLFKLVADSPLFTSAFKRYHTLRTSCVAAGCDVNDDDAVTNSYRTKFNGVESALGIQKNPDNDANTVVSKLADLCGELWSALPKITFRLSLFKENRQYIEGYLADELKDLQAMSERIGISGARLDASKSVLGFIQQFQLDLVSQLRTIDPSLIDLKVETVKSYLKRIQEQKEAADGQETKAVLKIAKCESIQELKTAYASLLKIAKLQSKTGLPAIVETIESALHEQATKITQLTAAGQKSDSLQQLVDQLKGQLQLAQQTESNATREATDAKAESKQLATKASELQRQLAEKSSALDALKRNIEAKDQGERSRQLIVEENSKLSGQAAGLRTAIDEIRKASELSEANLRIKSQELANLLKEKSEMDTILRENTSLVDGLRRQADEAAQSTQRLQQDLQNARQQFLEQQERMEQLQQSFQSMNAKHSQELSLRDQSIREEFGAMRRDITRIWNSPLQQESVIQVLAKQYKILANYVLVILRLVNQHVFAISFAEAENQPIYLRLRHPNIKQQGILLTEAIDLFNQHFKSTPAPAFSAPPFPDFLDSTNQDMKHDPSDSSGISSQDLKNDLDVAIVTCYRFWQWTDQHIISGVKDDVVEDAFEWIDDDGSSRRGALDIIRKWRTGLEHDLGEGVRFQYTSSRPLLKGANREFNQDPDMGDLKEKLVGRNWYKRLFGNLPGSLVQRICQITKSTIMSVKSTVTVLHLQLESDQKTDHTQIHEKLGATDLAKHLSSQMNVLVAREPIRIKDFLEFFPLDLYEMLLVMRLDDESLRVLRSNTFFDLRFRLFVFVPNPEDKRSHLQSLSDGKNILVYTFGDWSELAYAAYFFRLCRFLPNIRKDFSVWFAAHQRTNTLTTDRLQDQFQTVSKKCIEEFRAKDNSHQNTDLAYQRIDLTDLAQKHAYRQEIRHIKRKT